MNAAAPTRSRARRLAALATLVIATLPAPSRADTTPEAPIATPAPVTEPPAAPLPDGWLTVLCWPQCDSVWEDHRYVGPGSLVRRPMSAGVHRIVLARGLERRPLTVVISPGRETEVSPDGPWPRHRSQAAMVGGIIVTSLGATLVAGGAVLGYGFGGQQPSSDCDGCFSGPSIAGLLLMIGGGVLTLVGVPIAIGGGVPPSKPDAFQAAAPASRGPVVSWSLAPLTVAPLRGASASATPAGVAVGGAF
jgi:hypothetical protein